MNSNSNETTLIDEIDRLFVVYVKAKDYLKKIVSGIDEQLSSWQRRRDIIANQMTSSSPLSVDFLLPKAQRINELSIEAVQALCRVDLLIEQILRMDSKSIAPSHSISKPTSFSTRQLDLKAPHSTSTTQIMSNHTYRMSSPSSNIARQGFDSELSLNRRTLGQQSQSSYPMPVLRKQPQTPSSYSTVTSSQEKASFKPIEQQQQSSTTPDSTSRPTPIYPQRNLYPSADRTNSSHVVVPSHDPRPSSSVHISSPATTTRTTQMMSHIQTPRDKVKVKMQRIRPGTQWKRAGIQVVDTLSAFYVENRNSYIHSQYIAMFDELDKFYESLQQQNKLRPLENISIGDFGVAKYREDQRWYRARLLMAEENDQIGVVFIDFGNVETKSIDEFFPLDPSFANLPAQVVACTLSEAFPSPHNNRNVLWPPETIAKFRDIVTEGDVEVYFTNNDEGTEQWPLHFVQITVDNQTVTNILSLKQRIEPRPNKDIAEQLSADLSNQGYILFNVPITEDDIDQPTYE